MTLKPFGPHQCFMRSGSVKHFQTKSRGASSVREITKSSTIVSSPYARCNSSLLGLDDDHQVHAELSASIPKRGEKNLLVIGIVTCRPEGRGLTRGSA